MKDNKVFTATALEQIKRLARWTGPPIAIPEGKTLEEVILAPGGFADENMAWLQVYGALHALESNPLVTVSPAALGFVRVVAELARSGGFTAGIEQALEPVDGLLPKGRLGVKSKKAHAISASAPRKLWPNDIKKIKAEYARRVAAGDQHGAITDLSEKWKVSTKTVSRYVKPKAKGK